MWADTKVSEKKRLFFVFFHLKSLKKTQIQEKLSRTAFILISGILNYYSLTCYLNYCFFPDAVVLF